MRISKPLSIVLVSLFLAASAFWAESATAAPGVGDRAPDFTLQGASDSSEDSSEAALYTLSQHVGKRGVVLAWFPKAFTPG